MMNWVSGLLPASSAQSFESFKSLEESHELSDVDISNYPTKRWLARIVTSDAKDTAPLLADSNSSCTFEDRISVGNLIKFPKKKTIVLLCKPTSDKDHKDLEEKVLAKISFVSDLIVNRFASKIQFTDYKVIVTGVELGGSIYRCNGRCINEVCYSLKADVQLGGSCETIVGNQYYQCSGLFVCRSLTNGSQTTCQNKALKDEFCYTSSDCDTKLQCINSKCSNLNGKQVGTPCVYHMECDSGLCWNQVCSLNYNVTSCQNDNECLSYDSKCSCGGSASSSFIKPGTCVSLKRCKVFKSVLETCIGSNGRGLFPSLVFYDRNSTIHNACMKQFSQYFSCLRIGLTDANSRPSIPITGLDILAPVPENPAPFKIYQCLLFNSINFNVCGGAGDCVAENVCKCNKGYYEPFCWSIPPPTNSSTIKPIQSKIGNRNETISGSVSLRNVSMMAWMAIIVLIMSISL